MNARGCGVARAIVIAALAVLLGACASRPVRTSLPPEQLAAAEARQVARELELRRRPGWSLAGRIAVSNGRNGGSGRIDWQQAGARYDVSLSAPVTRQSWRLVGDGSGARLEGVEGGTREGVDAGVLLREATGWTIPVAALAEWVRGARAEGLGAAVVRYGDDGRVGRIEQGGWAIDYSWPTPAGPEALPERLDARGGEARVRLIIDQWESADRPAQ